ncbi:MAG: FGGY-family carbohydrate kinase [Firmicutes bacterium]|nr:FGGY-family carbohydrate kinase [Bacillota bacterium]
MSKNVLLGIDIGTSSCKVAAFSLVGETLGTAAWPYEIMRNTAYEAEQDAEEWWQAVCFCLQDLLGKGAFQPQDVAAIGVVGHSWATLPVDEQGNPLRNAMLWLDRRSLPECRYLAQAVGEEYMLELSGNRIDPAYCVPKMHWIRNNEPHVYAQAHKFLQSNSFIVHKLTGVFTQDASQGYGYYVFDTDRRNWSEAACERMAIAHELLPEVYESVEVVGEVTSRAASVTGLAAGTPVVAGGVDCAGACLGAGLIEHGATQEQAGQAGGMTIVTDRPYKDSRLISGCHVIDQCWHLSGGTVSGGVLNWFHGSILAAGSDLSPLGDGEQQPFERLSLEAEMSSAGAGGLLFLPYMAGERTPIWDPQARGVFMGLSYEKTRGDVVRSMMEGAAFALKHNLTVAGEAGIMPAGLISVGGGAKSRVWCQIKADVTQLPLGIPSIEDGTVFGAAVLGGIGVNAFSDWQKALKEMVAVKQWYQPSGTNTEVYDELYQIYLKSYAVLKDRLHQLASMG